MCEISQPASKYHADFRATQVQPESFVIILQCDEGHFEKIEIPGGIPHTDDNSEARPTASGPLFVEDAEKS